MLDPAGIPRMLSEALTAVMAVGSCPASCLGVLTHLSITDCLVLTCHKYFWGFVTWTGRGGKEEGSVLWASRLAGEVPNGGNRD